MSGTRDSLDAERGFLRDRGSRNLRRRRSAPAGRLTSGQRVVADRCDLLGGQRDAIDAHVPQPGMKRRRSVLLRAADEQVASRVDRGRDSRRLRLPSHHRHTSSARGVAGSSTTATCTHWFSTSGLAAVSPRTCRRRRPTRGNRRGSRPRKSDSRCLCRNRKQGPDAPVGRNNQPVTLIASSRPTAPPRESARWLPSPVSSRTLRNCGSSTNVPPLPRSVA